MRKVGVIPFDIKDDNLAILFVTSQARGRWILPKGNMKRDEKAQDTAHREGFEEAGVKGILLEEFPMTVPIGSKQSDKLEASPVTYFPLYVQDQVDEWPERVKRDRHWSLIEQAARIVHREDFLELLNRFEALRPWVTKAAIQRKEA